MTAMQSVVEPMAPTLQDSPLKPRWLFEPRWDGFRAICLCRMLSTTITLFNGVSNVGTLSYNVVPDPTFSGF